MMNLEEINNEELNEEVEIVLLKTIINYTICLLELENEKSFTMRKCDVWITFQLEEPNIESLIISLPEKDKIQAEKFLKGIDENTYKKYLKILRMKIRKYTAEVKSTILYPTQDDIEELANEVICYDKGINCLIKEANTNIYAKFELSMRYYGKDMNELFYNTCKELSEKKHKKATYYKAYCLFKGIGVQTDEKQAFEELYELVENSKYTYTKAITLLGQLYECNYEKEEHIEKAIELYNRVCEIDADAKFYLGRIYVSSYFSDEEKGMQLIEEAANMDCKQAAKFLINRYKNLEILKEKLDVNIECINMILELYKDSRILNVEFDNKIDENKFRIFIIEESNVREAFYIEKIDQNKYIATIDSNNTLNELNSLFESLKNE